MKCDEFILVADRQSENILAFDKEDQVLWRKHQKVLNKALSGHFLEIGFYKITVKSWFFGFVQLVEWTKLDMEL